MTMNEFYVRGYKVGISPNIQNEEFDYELDIATDSEIEKATGINVKEACATPSITYFELPLLSLIHI